MRRAQYDNVGVRMLALVDFVATSEKAFRLRDAVKATGISKTYAVNALRILIDDGMVERRARGVYKRLELES